MDIVIGAAFGALTGLAVALVLTLMALIFFAAALAGMAPFSTLPLAVGVPQGGWQWDQIAKIILIAWLIIAVWTVPIGTFFGLLYGVIRLALRHHHSAG